MMSDIEHIKSKPGERFVLTAYGFEKIGVEYWIVKKHTYEVPKVWLDNGWVVSVKESA